MYQKLINISSRRLQGLRVAADQAAAAAAAAPVASSSDGGGVSIEWATLKALVQHRQAQGGAGEHPIDIAEVWAAAVPPRSRC